MKKNNQNDDSIMNNTTILIVDEIIGNTVKLETETKDFNYESLYNLRHIPNLQEGDCLYIDSEFLYKNPPFKMYRRNDTLTAQRKKEIENRFKKLFNK